MSEESLRVAIAPGQLLRVQYTLDLAKIAAAAADIAARNERSAISKVRLSCGRYGAGWRACI